MLSPKAFARSRSGRVATYALSAVLVSAAMVACSSGNEASPSSSAASASDQAGGEPTRVGVVLRGTDQPRWAFDVKAITDQVEKNGDTLVGAYQSNDPAVQQQNVDSLITKGVDVIILAAPDSESGGALTKRAQAQKVDVIAYDNQVNATPNAYVARNNYDWGVLQAEAAMKAVPEGKFAVINGDPAVSAFADMQRAYDEKLGANSKVDVVANLESAGWTTENAQQNAEALLTTDPDVKAIVASWDGGAVGVIQALKSADLAGKVYVTGGDADKVNLQYIDQGLQGMSVYTDITKWGQLAADAAHELGNDETIKGDLTLTSTEGKDFPQLAVPVVTIDKSNLCQFIQEIAPEGWVTVADVFPNNPQACS